MLSKAAFLVLIKIKNVKKESFNKIIQEGSDLSATNVSDLHEIIRLKLSKSLSLQETKMLYEKATKEISDAELCGIQIITILDPKFPDKLKNIPNNPLVLYIKGDSSLLNAPLSVAVVGTREVSKYGADLSYKLSSDLASQGVVIVSGLALGCDTQAHLGCLASNGKTIAVLAHGLDSIYPAENTTLAQNILQKGGCLVSEYALGIKPQRFHFVNRNRIQSGLSQATLIVESKKQGGTMTTARHCLNQGRLLYCVQPNNGNERVNFEGNDLLIKEGAKSIMQDSVDDLLKAIRETSKISESRSITHGFLGGKVPQKRLISSLDLPESNRDEEKKKKRITKNNIDTSPRCII